MITTQEIKEEVMVSQGGEPETRLNAIVERLQVNITSPNPDLPALTPEEAELASLAGIEEMRNHYFDMMNPERLRASAPLDEAYKREAIKQAEAFLIADGFKLITDGKLDPSLFR